MSYILVLEDLDSDMRQFQSVLREIGEFEIKNFRAASLASEHLSSALKSSGELPRLIIVDLNLPDSSGYELLRFYHANPRLQEVPLVVWSVMDGETDKKLTTWMGAKKLISKNSGPATLRKSLAALLAPSA
jgi:CheY-like chemotaxis protein